MEYGITMFVTDYSIPATELAVAVEGRSFDALFVPDHTHIPADRTSPFADGDVLPDDYIRNYDMFATLTAAAAVTKRIRLGTGICLWSNATRSSPPSRSRVSIRAPVAVSILVLAAVGTGRRWSTTVHHVTAVDRSSANGSKP